MDRSTSPAPGSDGHAPRLRSGGWSLSRTELVLIFAFWTFFAVLEAVEELLDPRGPSFQFELLAGPITISVFESYLWALLTPLIFWLSSRYSIERANWVSRVLLFVGIGMAVAVLVDMAVDLFSIYIEPRRSFAGFSPLRGIIRLWFLNELIVYVAVIAAGFARDYFLRYRVRQEEAVRLQAQTAQLQAQLVEARLEALRMQIDPHFLFNTLHAVSTLIERDPRGARRMLARLSELLRHTLEGAREQEVPLEEELDFLGRYLEIMQIRFQGRLDVEMKVEPGVRDALVPNLILQPLVENAIKHGVSKVEHAGRIEVSAWREGDRLRLAVRDNGPAFTGEGAPNVEEGIGLHNTRVRLEQLYGTAQDLILRVANGGGLVAELMLPYHTRSDLWTTGLPVHPERTGV